MKYNLHAIATALGFFKQKAEGLRLKAVGQLSKKQLTWGLPQPALHKADALGLAMTVGGEGVRVNRSNSVDNSIAKSNNHSLTEKSALFYAVVMQELKHWLCSVKRSGGSLLLSSYRESNSLRGNERGDISLQKNFQFKNNRKSSQKQLTQGLSQPASHKADASGFTMTGWGEGVQINRSSPVSKKVFKSNNHSLTENFALTWGFLRKLWKTYQEKKKHREEVQRRLLRRRALKRASTPCLPDRQALSLTKREEESSKFKAESSKCRVESERFKAVGSGRFSVALLFLVMLSFGGYGQVKSLQVGDQLPKSVIETKNQAHLMLFISSGCKNFRAVLKDLDSLGKGAKLPVIAITTEKAEEMDPKVRDAYEGKTGVSWLMGDTYWNELFPHTIAPHLVWIDEKGKVVAISHAEGIDQQLLLDFKTGDIPTVAPKQDILDFEVAEKQLLEKYPRPKSYYSLVSSYLPGVNSINKAIRDSIAGTIHTSIVNFPLFNLYLMAFNRSFVYIPNRVVLEVKDKGNYIEQQSNLGKLDWYR
ncbi:hypothetical protein [Pedobacter alpinus]|uniref:Uncharacterized protein n=1 Tax=Pedobacter alpinus TaxID=1590643 RepID=A0ABW5TT16_9SPHI